MATLQKTAATPGNSTARVILLLNQIHRSPVCDLAAQARCGDQALWMTFARRSRGREMNLTVLATTRPLLPIPLLVLARRRTILLVRARLHLWAVLHTTMTPVHHRIDLARRHRCPETEITRIPETGPLTRAVIRRSTGANPRHGYIARLPRTTGSGGTKDDTPYPRDDGKWPRGECLLS